MRAPIIGISADTARRLAWLPVVVVLLAAAAEDYVELVLGEQGRHALEEAGFGLP